MPKFYAVRRGRNVGIYNSWDECKQQVNKFPGARYKSFKSCGEAEQFMNDVDCYSTKYKQHSDNYSHSSAYSKLRSYKSRPAYVRSSYYPGSCSSDSRSYSSDSTPRPVVYSDGCCYRNGRSGASAGVGVYWGKDSHHNVSEKLHGHQTNQRAELTAASLAVEGAIAQGLSSIEVKTDSTYTIKALTDWIHKWERNGWKTANGDDVKNRADMERLSSACKKIDVKWTHVAGHQGVAGNEMADHLAKLGSQK